MEVNERVAASWKMGTVLNRAVKAHTEELTANLATTVEELKQTKAAVAELLEARKNLAAAGRRYVKRNALLQRQLYAYQTLFGPLPSPSSQSNIVDALAAPPGEPLSTSAIPHPAGTLLRRTRSLELVLFTE